MKTATRSGNGHRWLAVAAAGALVGVGAGTSQAATINWANAADGTFSDTLKWTGGVVPGNDPSDIARFANAASPAYTVSFDAAPANHAQLNVTSGNVTLDLDTLTYTLSNRVLVAGNTVGNTPSLTITDGKIIAAASSEFGMNSGNGNGHVTVTTGGILQVSSDLASRTADLTVGRNSRASLEIINGGKVYNKSGFIGSNGNAATGSHTASAVVDGTGSLWDNSTDLRIGSATSFASTTLDITNGGKVISGTNNYVGQSSPAVVTISGTGSTWTTISGNLTLFANATLNVNNGGKVEDTGTSNLATVAGAKVNLSGTGTIIRNGNLPFTGVGTTLNVSNVGNVLESIHATNKLISFDANAVFNITLAASGADAATAYLGINGNLALGANGINVLFDGGYTPAAGHSFDLLDWTGTTTSLTTSNVHLPVLGPGLIWNTDLLGSDGIISIVPEPGVAALIGLGGITGCWPARRPRPTGS